MCSKLSKAHFNFTSFLKFNLGRGTSIDTRVHVLRSEKMNFKTAFHVHLQFWIVTQVLAEGSLRCEDLINRFKYPDPQLQKRILLLHFDYINQSNLINVLEHFTRLRDLHSKSPYFSAQVILVNIIAVAFNASLASLTDFPWHCYRQHRNISRIMINAHLAAVKNTSSALLPMGDIGFNFAYCAHRKLKAGGVEMLKLFGDSADFAVWTCLILSLAMTTILVKRVVAKDFSEVLITISSVLLSSGISGNNGNSKLFLLWVFVCMVFVTYFSGSLTSVLIHPPPDDRFTTIEELHAHNY